MSLGCFECESIGSYNTLIIFNKKGKFDKKKPTSNYPNYYTCCADFRSFERVNKSNFAVVKLKEEIDHWLTGNDGALLKNTKFKLIKEEAVKSLLPKIYKALKE